MDKNKILVVSLIVLLAVVAVILGFVLRDEPDIPPDPLVSQPKADAAVLVLEAGDRSEGDAESDAGTRVKQPGKSNAKRSRLIACCRVLAQNAKSQGNLATRGSMMQAAAVCEASASTGQYEAVESILDKYDVPCE